MKKILIIMLIILLLIIPVAGCSTPSVEENSEEETVSEDVPEEQVEVAEEADEENDFIRFTAPDELPYLIKIDTAHIASIALTLAKGEIFSVRMHIDGDLIFYILDPSRYMLYDAGLIEGEYEFSLTAPRSGDYILSFIDSYGHRDIDFYHDYAGTIWNASR